MTTNIPNMFRIEGTKQRAPDTSVLVKQKPIEKKEILKLFEPNKIAVGHASQGSVGYDNIRENIDPAIRTRAIYTIEGKIEKTPTESNDIANKAYVDAAPPSITRQTFAGSDCAGNDGDANRTLAIAAEPFLISVDGIVIAETTQYTYAAGTITFLIDIWNEQKIGTWR